MAKGSTAVAKKEEAGLPAHIADMEQYAGAGNSTSAQDNVLPYLAIIQKGSPQINDKKPEFIADAKVGMIFNTATGELWNGDEGVQVVAFHYLKKMVEWIPRNSGGGFVAQYEMDDAIVKTKKPRIIDGKQRGFQLPNGNDLVETAYTLCRIKGRPGLPVVVAGASSALTPMRKWMSYRNNVFIPGTEKIAPSFAKLYTLKTVYQENESGDWYNWKHEDAGWAEESDFRAASELWKAANSGEFELGRPPESAEDGDGGHGDDGIPV